MAAASAPVSDLGIRRESVQDAIQKFMYHDDVRPKFPMMGWLRGVMWEVQMAVARKKQISWKFGNLQ